MLDTFDKGPTKRVARIFAAVPDYGADKDIFWFNWGPIFYRGRLNKRIRLLVVASDPGPTERLVCRSLVGDAGQRVQGFLSKLGLTESYLCLNAHPYSLFPSNFSAGKRLLRRPDLTAWRNRVFRNLTGDQLQAIVCFGSQAKEAVRLWDTAPAVPILHVPHPSSRDAQRLASEWANAITTLRGVITPDDVSGLSLPNYSTEVGQSDYAAIPKRDLPFGLPHWIGDDPPKSPTSNFRKSSVRRDGVDKIIWNATGR